MDWATFWTIILQVTIGFSFAAVLIVIGVAAIQAVRDSWRRGVAEKNPRDG